MASKQVQKYRKQKPFRQGKYIDACSAAVKISRLEKYCRTEGEVVMIRNALSILRDEKGVMLDDKDRP